jgi:hypothetical protein
MNAEQRTPVKTAKISVELPDTVVVDLFDGRQYVMNVKETGLMRAGTAAGAIDFISTLCARAVFDTLILANLRPSPRPKR